MFSAPGGFPDDLHDHRDPRPNFAILQSIVTNSSLQIHCSLHPLRITLTGKHHEACSGVACCGARVPHQRERSLQPHS
jgi:hypothetical protein